MKIKSNVLFGLIVVIFLISGFSLLKRLTRDVDEWRPSDLYSTTNVSRRSTYSVVSSGASASYSGAVPSVSSGASSVFRHRGVSSYVPVVSAPASSPLASSPLASSPQGGLYATSSAEFRSFGGGGNVGGVFMSGGTVKSSGSSMASASGLSISMPNASMYAFAGQGANNNIPVVSGDAAMAAMTSTSSYTTAYSGIGRTTTGGAFRGISGRRESNGAIFNSWWNWLSSYSHNNPGNGVVDENGNWIYTYDKYDLQQLYNDFIAFWSKNFGSGDLPEYDEWLEWYISTTGSDGYSYKNDTYLFQPIGGALPLVVMALIYLCCTVLRRKMKEQI